MSSLAASYEYCRKLHREHGRTYYLATALLPRWKRPHVHALYGFTRHTDDIVDRAETDHTGSDRVEGVGADTRTVQLRQWRDSFHQALTGASAPEDPVLPALRHTIEMFNLDLADFEAFLRSMEMDLTVTEYPSYRDLLGYMDGSGAAIGTMMLPILGTVDRAAAREPARQLGYAFQLTNFIRDVGEDLDRGRVYLPLADLDRFGVTVNELRAGLPTIRTRQLIAFEVARARRHYALAAVGIPMLVPTSQACVRTAFRVYGAILDEVAHAGYDVFSRRATVATGRRLALTAASVLTRPNVLTRSGTPARTGTLARSGGAGSTEEAGRC